MKIITVSFLFIVVCAFSTPQNTLQGKYMMLNNKEHKELDGILTITGSSYSKYSPSGKTIMGKIDDKKFVFFLQDENSKYRILISKSQLKNDTINFGVEDITIPKSNDLTVVPNTGKFIKLR
ncbi:MAG: hypothetical protein EOO50_13015 [Flavobacterium sp.]|uniref:hypothetical protein n=1 Tax=Flavobacterium sp. TaxID=239 RepID=UPI0011FE570A|nr:hypothetical protein [Flavobacterium sp.]RZJ65570.1 MAG: hypothetical protein EOO50_13015 [Flavobacterium sp.]